MLRTCSCSQIRLCVPLLSNEGVFTHHFCSLWQCFAYPRLGCYISTLSFISLCVWSLSLLIHLWHLEGFTSRSVFTRCRGSQIKEIPWTQTIFWMESSFSWRHPHPDLMWKRILWGLELDDVSVWTFQPKLFVVSMKQHPSCLLQMDSVYLTSPINWSKGVIAYFSLQMYVWVWNKPPC